MASTYSSVLFENENFIAVDKKSGVLSVPSRMGKEDPRPVLGLELQETLKKQIFPVHRLDFEVSGMSKNDKTIKNKGTITIPEWVLT